MQNISLALPLHLFISKALMDIRAKIISLRWEQVLLDKDLAELYWIENRVLKQAVRRNLDRFPDDFMFILSKHEVSTMVSQFVIPSKQHLGWAQIFAFTEHGILMLANVLKSPQALNVSLQIIRQFIAMRKIMILSGEFQEQLNDIKTHLWDHDDLLNQLCFDVEKIKYEEEKPTRTIGFRSNK